MVSWLTYIGISIRTSSTEQSLGEAEVNDITKNIIYCVIFHDDTKFTLQPHWHAKGGHIGDGGCKRRQDGGGGRGGTTIHERHCRHMFSHRWDSSREHAE